MKEDNTSMKHMIEEVEASHEEKLEWGEIELEKCKNAVAEAEACTLTLTKDEPKKKHNEKNTKPTL